jgi:hypothetical protein
MIIRQSNGPLGSRISVLRTPDGRFVTVSTGKQHRFERPSTVIMEGKPPGCHFCGKVTYVRSLRLSDNQQCHDAITQGIDNALVANGGELRAAIYGTLNPMIARGLVSEITNIAS